MREPPWDDDPPGRRERPSGSMAEATWSATTAAARAAHDAALGVAPPAVRTPRRRRRAKRDAVIVLCSKAGLSVRYIAEAFGLARSTVAVILERAESRGR